MGDDQYDLALPRPKGSGALPPPVLRAEVDATEAGLRDGNLGTQDESNKSGEQTLSAIRRSPATCLP